MGKPQGKNAGDKGRADAAPAAPRDEGAEVLGSGNLEQVREILFGAHSRNVEKRLARLEEELPKRVAEIREELKRGVATLEAYARREIDALNDRLRTEVSDRGTGDERLAAKVEESTKGWRKEVAQLGEGATAAQRDLRQQLLDQSKRFDDEIQRRTDDLAAALARAVEELRSEKADRKAVAGVLHEVAMRLTDELALPLGDGTKS